MQAVRLAILSVLLLFMLPWGAYAHGWAPAGPPAASASAAPLIVDEAMVPIRITTAKKCRVAMLPGSTCGPDLILAALALSPRSEGAATAPRPEDVRPARTLSPTPPRDPPRRF